MEVWVRLMVEGFILGLMVAIPLGPVNITMMRRALAVGFWNATVFGGGSVSADMFYITLVYFGVAPLLAGSAWLRVVLWLFGAVWLAWLAVDAMRSAQDPALAEALPGASSNARSYFQGIGITLLNPLTIMGWLTLGGGYFALHPETQSITGGLAAVLSIVGGLITYNVVVSAALAVGRRWLPTGFIRGMSVIAGVFLLVIALTFLVSAAQVIFGGISPAAPGAL